LTRTLVLHIVYNMQDQIIIARARDQARSKLREMLVSGAFEPGEHLDEVGLSRRLGASRTPIREALIGLEEEGLVASRPNRGFAIVALDERAINEIYQIIGALETEAVLAGGAALREAATSVGAINEKLKRESRPARRNALDREFHRALVMPCGNERLFALLETQWNQSQRVDGAQKRGLADHEGSCSAHDNIVEAIKRNDLVGAAGLVRGHWHDGKESVLKWLRDNP
jgi:DNA-binding GntR family transcriptional regulator